MYEPHAALAAIDANTAFIMICLLLAAGFAFAYFFIAARLAIRQQVYVVPFVAAALFFWHDLTYVLMYDRWFNVYRHWWVELWWYALVGTVALEVFMIYQVIRYGHQELWPELSRRAFTWLIIAGTVAVGSIWALIKAGLSDELFFVTFAITAVFSVPFHTALMVKRRSRAGQSIAMQLAVVVMISSETVAFSRVDAFFRSPVYLFFAATFAIWALVNVWLIRRLPERAPMTASAVSPG